MKKLSKNPRPSTIARGLNIDPEKIGIGFPQALSIMIPWCAAHCVRMSKSKLYRLLLEHGWKIGGRRVSSDNGRSHWTIDIAKMKKYTKEELFNEEERNSYHE